MPAKNAKNKSHMRRFRVKYKRRRQCKTNYPKRIRLVAQYKDKYGTPKYRLVVRKTNRDIIAQIISSDMTHDKCHVSAYAHELKDYGIEVGFTNYAAAYCVGLLLARRLLTKFQKDNEGNDNIDGDFYLDDDSFKANLDTGLVRCTTGANIFGVLKGAVDGGLNIPHNTRRFPGSSYEEGDDGKEWVYEPSIHRERIFGQHIANHMSLLKSEDEAKYNKLYSNYIKKNIHPGDIEQIYTKAHQQIRENPNKPRDELEKGYFAGKRTQKRKEKSYYDVEGNQMKYNKKKMTGKEKKLAAMAKIEKLREEVAANANE